MMDRGPGAVVWLAPTLLARVLMVGAGARGSSLAPRASARGISMVRSLSGLAGSLAGLLGLPLPAWWWLVCRYTCRPFAQAIQAGRLQVSEWSQRRTGDIYRPARFVLTLVHSGIL